MVWVHDTVFRRHNAIHTQNSITSHTYCMWKRAGTIIADNHWYFKFDNLQRCRDKKKDINISSCVFAFPPPVTCTFKKSFCTLGHHNCHNCHTKQYMSNKAMHTLTKRSFHIVHFFCYNSTVHIAYIIIIDVFNPMTNF